VAPTLTLRRHKKPHYYISSNRRLNPDQYQYVKELSSLIWFIIPLAEEHITILSLPTNFRNFNQIYTLSTIIIHGILPI